MAPGAEPDLNNLPSHQKFYSKFNAPSESECNNTGAKPEDLEGKLQDDFNGCEQIIDDADKIAKAYCYACKLYDQSKPNYDNTPCEFFYFWLGDQYGNDLGDKSLYELLNKIYQTLNITSYTNPCRIYYDDVSWDLFNHRKTVFDYSFDHKSVPEYLLKNGLNCEDQLSTYVNEIASACDAIRTSCKTGGSHASDSYCSDFNTMYKVHCDLAEALHLYCTEASTLRVGKTYSSVNQKLQAERASLSKLEQEKAEAEAATQSTQLKLNEAVHQATTSSSLSSAFGSIALMELPALLFLAYKYKPWSSWFGNHTYGNEGRSNRRRKRAIGQDLDDLTENNSTFDSTDDSSTIGPTERSTATSAAYARESRTGPYTRGRAGTNANNNNTPGQHKRTNVGYGRM